MKYIVVEITTNKPGLGPTHTLKVFGEFATEEQAHKWAGDQDRQRDLVVYPVNSPE